MVFKFIAQLLQPAKPIEIPLVESSVTPPSPKRPAPTIKMVACPYCGVILDPPPSRSRKCPDCRVAFVVRKADGDTVTLKTDDVARFDEERAFVLLRRAAIRRASMIGRTETDFKRAEGRLRKKWGSAPPNDVFWGLANEAVLSHLKAGRLHDAGMVHFEMARLLFDTGRPHVDLLREAHITMAKGQIIQTSQFRDSFTIAARGCCADCEKYDGRKVKFSKALNPCLLPIESCTRGWCNCCFV